MTHNVKTIFAILVVIIIAGAGIAAVALWDSAYVSKIASFSTDLAPRTPQQRHNILRAASKINGMLIRPGEEFSFNKAVGLCGVEQGFERAPTIVAGELRPEWGGGVCQVSSTLYNAALLAGLSITERHAHSRRVSSVPPGRDATTAFGIADLKFVNTTGNAIRIKASATRTRLAISILGKSREKSNIQIITQILSRGRSTIGGETVLTYRLTPLADGSFRRDLISNDLYSIPAYADNNEVKR